MELKLDKPLIVFDIEATGISVSSDRIVELGMLKIMPDGNRERKNWRFNPGLIMSEEVIAIHGITNEQVSNCPSFADKANEIKHFIEGADFAGYNSNRFDVPMLVEEFLRCGVGFDENRKYIDVMRIFTKMEKRTLEAALQFFCGRSLENAHSADADVDATWDVLQAQVRRYKELQNDARFLADFSNDEEIVDFGRRMIYRDGVEVFNFGKNKGRTVEEVFRKEPQYYNWMMKADFPMHTKLKLKHIMLRLKMAKS